MQLIIKVQDLKDKDKPLFPEIGQGFVEFNLESVGILESGMQSGKPSLWLNLRKPDGTIYVIAQISADMLDGIKSALDGARQRWANAKGE